MGVAVRDTRERPPGVRRRRHLAGGALGIGYVVALEAARTAELQLRAVMQRDVTWWPLWVMVGLFVLLGAATGVAVLLAPRLPWLPTAAAAVLSYSLVASLPLPTVAPLPHPWPWFPRAHHGLTTLALLLGLLLVAAVWGWWSYRQHGTVEHGTVEHGAAVGAGPPG